MNKYVFLKSVCVFVLVYLVLQMQNSSQIIYVYVSVFVRVFILKQFISEIQKHRFGAHKHLYE